MLADSGSRIKTYPEKNVSKLQLSARKQYMGYWMADRIVVSPIITKWHLRTDVGP